MRLMQIIMIGALTGCGMFTRGDILSPDDMALGAKIYATKHDSPYPYKYLGRAYGASCDAGESSDYSSNEILAIQRMKADAARYKADAVIESECRLGHQPLKAFTCGGTIICSGTAIRYQK